MVGFQWLGFRWRQWSHDLRLSLGLFLAEYVTRLVFFFFFAWFVSLHKLSPDWFGFFLLFLPGLFPCII